MIQYYLTFFKIGISNAYIEHRRDINMDCQQCGKCCEYNGVHFSQSHLDHLINKYNLDRDTIISELSQYGTFYKAWNACPFFTEDKKCLIHEDSPIECMMFLFIDFNN